MILPENGSVVVIDDDPNQARPIIDALAKKGIATTYFRGRGENDVPKKPLSNVRLAIVDLQLIEGSRDEHTIATSLINVLQKIISLDNGPYMLLIWSLKERSFGEEFKNQIRNPEHGIVPVCIATLEKAKCLQRTETKKAIELADSVIEEIKPTLEEINLETIKNSIINNFQEDEQFEATPNAIEVIESSLKSTLEKAGVFHLFVIWENLIRKAGYQTVNAVSSTIEYTDLWEMNMRDVLNRMAKARTGQNTLPDDLTLKAALSTFSGAFSEELEYDIRKLNFPDYVKLESNFSIAGELKGDIIKIIVYPHEKKWKVKILKNDKVYMGKENVKLESISNITNGINDPEKSFIDNLVLHYLEIPFRINTKLHLEQEPTHIHLPGNVYRINVPDERKREILTTYFMKLPQNVSDYHFIELEVSPICDYAQKKWKKSRLLSGLVYPYSENLKAGDFFYRNSPVIIIDRNKYRMVFCYLIFKAHDVKEVEEQGKPWFRIKRELLQDIVTKLSCHISRSGITTVE